MIRLNRLTLNTGLLGLALVSCLASQFVSSNEAQATSPTVDGLIPAHDPMIDGKIICVTFPCERPRRAIRIPRWPWPVWPYPGRIYWPPISYPYPPPYWPPYNPYPYPRLREVPPSGYTFPCTDQFCAYTQNNAPLFGNTQGAMAGSVPGSALGAGIGNPVGASSVANPTGSHTSVPGL